MAKPFPPLLFLYLLGFTCSSLQVALCIRHKAEEGTQLPSPLLPVPLLGEGREQGNECQIDKINALEPTSRVRSEAGVTEFWDPNEDQFRCAGVAFMRRFIQPNGLLLPYFRTSPELYYVIRGKGIRGMALPGCPETFQSVSKGGEQEGRIRDQHQRITRFRQGDIFALPAGVVQWLFNDGEEDLILVNLLDTTNDVNQLDQSVPRGFFLAGKPQQEFQEEQGQRGEQGAQNVLEGLDLEILEEVLGVPRETVERLRSSTDDRRGQIVRAEQLRVIRPPITREDEEWEERRRGEEEWEEHRRRGTGGRGSEGEEWEEIHRGGRGSRGEGQEWEEIHRGGKGRGSRGGEGKEWEEIHRGGRGRGSRGGEGEEWEETHHEGRGGRGSRGGQGEEWEETHRGGRGGRGSRGGEGEEWEETHHGGRRERGSRGEEGKEWEETHRGGRGGRGERGSRGEEGKEWEETHRGGRGGRGSRGGEGEEWEEIHRGGRGRRGEEGKEWEETHRGGRGGRGSRGGEGEEWEETRGGGRGGRGSRGGEGEEWEEIHREDRGSQGEEAKEWEETRRGGRGERGSRGKEGEEWEEIHRGSRGGRGSRGEGREKWEEIHGSIRGSRGEEGTEWEETHRGGRGGTHREEGKEWEESRHGGRGERGSRREEWEEIHHGSRGGRGSRGYEWEEIHGSGRGREGQEWEEVHRKGRGGCGRGGQRGEEWEDIHSRGRGGCGRGGQRGERWEEIHREGGGWGGCSTTDYTLQNAVSNDVQLPICTLEIRASINDPSRAQTYVPQAGRLTSLTSSNLPILRALRLSAERGVLYKNALMGPHWSLNAHNLIYATRGSARVQIVNDRGQDIFHGVLKENQLVVAPQNFILVKQAGDEGFEWVSFKTNDNAIVQTIAGRTSFIKALPIEVIMSSYQVSRDEAERLKNERKETLLLAGRSRSSGEGESERRAIG